MTQYVGFAKESLVPNGSEWKYKEQITIICKYVQLRKTDVH